ncbi:hypothetical protein [Bradyrhizobium centrosematis]|nr:hypothetical protein [Bradyrhizobium centrosematis]MCS3758656.1 hypothetical protein [Bradyrhizobium centrosematis]MCS3773456.1 hypothetical protein [Bradyrhizobium centrosematis]
MLSGIMPKVFFGIVVAISGLVAADRHYSYGVYTDAVLAMLRHMRHSFGW